jgi:hypothetical protein
MCSRVAEKPRPWAGDGERASAVTPQSRAGAESVAAFGNLLVAIGGAWDVTPDGRRIAALAPVDSTAPKPEHVVTFLQNFFDELRRKAPLDKQRTCCTRQGSQRVGPGVRTAAGHSGGGAVKRRAKVGSRDRRRVLRAGCCRHSAMDVTGLRAGSAGLIT